MRLLVDHRERLVAQRTALINDLRWGLHDLWPELEIPPRALIRRGWQERVAGRLARAEQTTRVRIARDELRRIRELTRAIDALERELAALVAALAPRLLAERGCGVLTAAKLIGEIAGVERFATDAKLARTAGVGADPGLLGAHRPPPPRPRRQPPAQLRAAPPRRHQGAAWTPRPPPTSPASRPKARPAAKRCAASSATSPAASGKLLRPSPRTAADRRSAPARRSSPQPAA